MRHSKIFLEKLGCSTPEEVFEYFMASLKETITKWDYFVNWGKVFDKVTQLEIDLNILNCLIGKQDIEREFAKLINDRPSLVQLIPVLIACRQNKFQILKEYGYEQFEYQTYSFKRAKHLTPEQVHDAVQFAKLTGFLDLLADRKIKSIVDYVIGVEVGLDSNGRKNRGGKMMEEIIEFYVSDICKRNDLQYIPQATSSKVREKFGLKMSVDKSSRKVDFAVFNGKKLYLIETNFYGGGGSKLKATAGEYQTMFDYWTQDGHGFIWVTDGKGWKTTRRPLEETFNHVDYVLNLEMLSKKMLEDILIENL